MRTVIKNGKKYVITDSLYESIKRNGLFEAGESNPLTVNPQQATQQVQQNNQNQQVQQNNQNQQNNQQQNLQQANEINTKFINMLKNELQQNNIKVDGNVDNIIVAATKSYDYNTKVDYIRNPNTNTHVGIFNEIKKEITNKQNNNTNNSSTLDAFVFGEVKLIKQQLQIALEAFEKEAIDEINNKLRANYKKEDINIAQQILDNAFPTKKDIEERLIPFINEKFSKKSYSFGNIREAVENNSTILNSDGTPLNKSKKDTTKVDVSVNSNNNLDIINYIKDFIYAFVSNNTTKNEDFINNTKKYSKELGKEWLDNFNTKLGNYIKGGIYSTAYQQGLSYGALDMHRYDTNDPKDIDKMWDKVLENMESLQPENEVEDVIKEMFKKATEIIKDIEKDRENKDRTTKVDNPDPADNLYVMKRTMCYLFNDTQRIMEETDNQAKTYKVNKNFINDIINDNKLIDYLNKSQKSLVRGNRMTKEERESNLEKTTKLCRGILNNYVFSSGSTPSNYVAYANKNNTGKNKKLQADDEHNKNIKSESYSKYNILFLTEEGTISVDKTKTIEEKVNKLGIFYSFLIGYTGFIYDLISRYYSDIKDISRILISNKQKSTDGKEDNVIDETTNTLENFYNNVVKMEVLMTYNLISKVLRYVQIWSAEIIEDDITNLIPKEYEWRDLDTMLKQFANYMGRQPMLSDIEESEKIYNELKDKIKTMGYIIGLYRVSLKKHYATNRLDYIIRYSNVIDQNMKDEILSKKTNDENNNFLRKCLAYNILYKFYVKNKNVPNNDNRHIGKYKTLLEHIFNNDKDFSDEKIMRLVPEVWKSGKKIPLGSLITILNKTLTVSKKFKMDQDFDVSLLWDKKPIIIKEKSDDDIVGVITFVSFDALTDMFRNFDINKLIPKIHGKKRI